MQNYPALQSQLGKAVRQDWALKPLFSDMEIRNLDKARCAMDGQRRVVAYAVYENHYARGGGVFAVADSLPQALSEFSDEVLVLSPFHRRLETAPHQPGDPLGELAVPFAGSSVKTTLYEYESQGVTWVLFGAEGFFEAPGGPHGKDPYDHSSVDRPDVDSNPLLLRDGLFAAAAIPRILRQLGLTRNLVIHVQDWQLAATALTVKEAILQEVLNSAIVVLTMHNPYDCGLTAGDLAQITERVSPDRWPLPATDGTGLAVAARGDFGIPYQPRNKGEPMIGDPALGRVGSGDRLVAAVPGRRETVYQCMIPLFDAPISTVSRQFAKDLIEHPLQTVHFADHLQQVLRLRGLVGVDHGLFMKPHCPFTTEALDRASRGDFEPILAEKQSKRAKMLEVLAEYHPPARIGRLLVHGDEDLTRLPDDIPLFMMFGRMDPGQKGFDVLAHAVRKLGPNTAKFVVCPMVPARTEAFLGIWRDIANERTGEVVVFPFRMQQGYLETMAGATYCIMPSLYEPFGAATEPFLQGSPVVAAATGGLVQQVVDVGEDFARATGILYRPHFPNTAEQQGRQWRAILECPDPASRMHFPLYVSLVEELAASLTEATRIYQTDKPLYGRMLSRLYPQATGFDWRQAATEYTAINDAATRPLVPRPS